MIDIGLADAHGFHLELDRNVGVDGGHALAEDNGVAIVLERFPVGFLFDFGGAVEGLLDGAEALDDLDRTFVADAGSAGNIVDAVTAQGHDIDDALGRNAENFFDVGGVADQIVFGRVQDLHVVVDELHHVFIAGDNVDAIIRGGGFAGEGSDHVIGLEAGEFEDGDAVGFEGAADVGNLLRKILGHGGAVGFVAFVFDFGEGLGFDVELADGGDGFGLSIAKSLGGYVENRGEIGGREIIAQ